MWYDATWLVLDPEVVLVTQAMTEDGMGGDLMIIELHSEYYIHLRVGRREEEKRRRRGLLDVIRGRAHAK